MITNPQWQLNGWRNIEYSLHTFLTQRDVRSYPQYPKELQVGEVETVENDAPIHLNKEPVTHLKEIAL